MLVDATARLAGAGVPSPRVDAQEIASFVLGIPRERLILHSGDEISAEQGDEIASLLERRAAREPLQHIVGAAPFGPLSLAVGPGVFIPRPETEVLADWASRELRRLEDTPGRSAAPVVVDLCTGSGALAAFLADAHPAARIVAVELDPVARRWAARNLPERVELVAGDVTRREWIDQCPGLAGAVDLVVSNPPYVPASARADLPPEVHADPDRAVFSGEDGMDVITALPDVLDTLLKPGGILGIEHDDSTAAACRELFAADPRWTDVRSLADLSGRDRFVIAGKL
nr:peptide chain release factor N(5)-glutamine methyltransferase [Corynebacterium uropygiale]